MKDFADHFSRRAREYARYRPHHPPELFDYLASVAPARDLAWDCGTGSGQAALALGVRFEKVVATDASAEQIAQAVPNDHVEYRVERAEDVSLAPASVDLVTVAAAVHWFDLDPFYAAVRRVLVPNGIIAVWTYHKPQIDPGIDQLITDFDEHVLKPYWPERFHHVREHYARLPFPFDTLTPPSFRMQADWTLDQFLGFAASWSATQRYVEDRGEDPLVPLRAQLSKGWGEEGSLRNIRWPIYLRVGRVKPAAT